MIRAHLRRSIGGGLGGPLRSLPQESVARAKPALEAERLSLGGAISDRLPACHVRVFHFRAPALPAQRILGGRYRKGGEAPLRMSAALAPSAARSTYGEYASRAALGRRLAGGPFSSL